MSRKTTKEINSTFGILRPDMSDKEYWERFEEDEDGSKLNSDISLDVFIRFFGINGEIYSTKEKGINANPTDLNQFIENLKKVIKMLDTTNSDRVSDNNLS